jgi:hypothetical protein
MVINLCFREIYALSSKLHTALLMMFYDLVVRLLTAHSLVNVVGMSRMVIILHFRLIYDLILQVICCIANSRAGIE